MRLFVHQEARPWIPTEEDLSVLWSFYDGKLPDGRIYLWPRRLAERVYGKRTGPYAFRAFTRKNESHLFVDPSETKESIGFLLAHELCHQLVETSPTLSLAFGEARPVDLGKVGDTFHRIDPEERFCDGIANRLLGTRYDRGWWRGRLARQR